MLECLTLRRSQPLLRFSWLSYSFLDQSLSLGGASVAFGTRAGDYDEEHLAPRSYDLPDLPWEIIAGRLEPITISTLRFDAASRPPVWPPVGSCAAT